MYSLCNFMVSPYLRSTAACSLVGDLDNACNRRNAIAIHQEQHVVARRGKVSVCRGRDLEASADRRELEMVQAPILIERMGDGWQANQSHLADIRPIRRAHIECLTVWNTGRAHGG